MSYQRDDRAKVSVCVVTYNQARFIGQAVESVLDQTTNFPVEIIVGEDCSTDETRSIVEVLANRHPERIRLLLADRNLGTKQNFMRTFRECHGEYVAILEGDDYWTCPHKLQLQVDALDARPDLSICFHPAQILFEDWRVPPSQWPVSWDKPEATLADLFVTNFIPTNAALFRNGLFAELPPWFEKVLIGDWPLHMLNAEHGNIGFLPQVMSVYRVHAGGMYSSMSRGAQLAAIFKMLSAVDRHFKGKYSEAIDECRIGYLNETLATADNAAKAAGDPAGLSMARQRLAEENRQLRDVPWRWLTRRVAREASRPVKQLLNKLHHRSSNSQRDSRAA